MLTIWGRTNSINVQKVMWCCAELGLAHKRIDAGLAFGINNTPEYLARNPTGLVPTIDDDGYILWESNTIVRYLSSKHGLGTLCPNDAQTRFLAERWMDWQLSAAVPLGTLYRGLIRTPPEKRDNNAIAAAQKASEEAMKILDGHLAGRDFMEAGCLTIGDITTGVMAYRWFGLGNPKEAMPNLGRYYEGLTGRAGYREHVMLPLT